MKKVVFLLGILLIMLVIPTSAEQDVKTITMPIGYQGLAMADTLYVYNFSVDYPDGIDRVLGMELLVQGDYSDGAVTTGGFLAGPQLIFCTPQNWTVYTATNNYEMSFDCTELLQDTNWKGGNLSFLMMVDRLSANVKTRARITYYNDPPGSTLGLFGTEYYGGASGTTFLQLFDGQENPVDDGFCELDIYYPDKTKWMDDSPMTFLHNGLYYKDFTTPSIPGVYIVDAFCYYADILYDFRIPESVNISDTCTYIDTESPYALEDTDCSSVKSNCDVMEFLFDDPEIGNVNVSGVTTLDFVWSGMISEDGYLQAYNYDNSSWVNMGEAVDRRVGDFACEGIQHISRDIQQNISSYVNGDESKFRMFVQERDYQIPVNATQGVVNTTTSTTLEDINGSDFTLSLSQQTSVFMAMSVSAYTSTGADGWFGLNFNNSDKAQISRGFGSGDKPGSIFVVDLVEDVPAGTYTVKGRHNVSEGALTTTSSIMAFALEDGINTMDNCMDTISSDTTTATVFEDIEGLSCEITTATATKQVMVFLAFNGKVDTGNKDINYVITIDGIDYEVNTRGFESADSYGALSTITLSNTLSIGTHTIKARWKTESGTTATGENFKLIVISNEAGNRHFDVAKSITSSVSTTATSPEDIEGTDIETTINSDSKIGGFMSLVSSSGSGNKEGYYLVNINNQDYTTFTRFYSSAGIEGSVSAIALSDELGEGDYTTKGRWYTEGVNVLSGEQVILLSMGFNTKPAPYVTVWTDDASLIFHNNGSVVANLRGAGEIHVSEVSIEVEANVTVQNVTVTGNVTVGNLGDIAGQIWNYSNKTVDFSDVDFPYEIDVFGTYYEVGDDGRIFLTLGDENVQIDNASCWLWVEYPYSTVDNRSYFIERSHMVAMGEMGLYYYDFTVPDTVGIYIVSAICDPFAIVQSRNATSENLIEGVVQTNDYTASFVDDGTYYVLREQNNGGGNRSFVHDWYFDLSDVPDYNLSTNELIIDWIGRKEEGTDETFYFYLYNWTSAEFKELPNELNPTAGLDDIVSNSIISHNDYFNSSGYIRVRITDSVQVNDTGNDRIAYDQFRAGGWAINASFIEVAGGGELNVKDRLADIEALLNSTYSEVLGLEQYLLTILDNQELQTQFTEEEIYLITDAVTALTETKEAIINGDIEPEEGKEKIKEITQKFFNNKAFETPNEITLDAFRDFCVAHITNEGKVRGFYEVEMQIEGHRREVHELTLEPLETKQVVIKMNGLDSGEYYCKATSHYNLDGRSSARTKIIYDADSREASMIEVTTQELENTTFIDNFIHNPVIIAFSGIILALLLIYVYIGNDRRY